MRGKTLLGGAKLFLNDDETLRRRFIINRIPTEDDDIADNLLVNKRKT